MTLLDLSSKLQNLPTLLPLGETELANRYLDLNPAITHDGLCILQKLFNTWNFVSLYAKVWLKYLPYMISLKHKWDNIYVKMILLFYTYNTHLCILNMHSYTFLTTTTACGSPSQESNPCHSYDLSHCRDNAVSLAHCATVGAPVGSIFNWTIIQLYKGKEMFTFKKSLSITSRDFQIIHEMSFTILSEYSSEIL